MLDFANAIASPNALPAAIGLIDAPLCRHEDVVGANLRREQLLGHIRTINPSASIAWLDGFEDRQLQDYLEHLQKTLEPRGRTSTWLRRGDTPGIVWRASRE
jgi:hypothetical protein